MWMALLTEGFLPFPCMGLVAGWGSTPGPLADWEWPWSRLGLCYGIYLLSSCTVVVAFSFPSTMAFWSPAGAEEISSVAVSFTRQLKLFPLDGHCWPMVC